MIFLKLSLCSEPGVSGAKFDDANFARVINFKKKYPNLFIGVDGGINKEIGEIFTNIGVDLLVSGSFLCKNKNELYQRIYTLKYGNEFNINVKRVMNTLNELPIIGINTCFIDIITTINKYRQAIVYVVKNKELVGIITDGDIRRSCIKYQKTVFDLKAEDLMNKNPFTISSEYTLDELYFILFSEMKGINNIPVIEKGCFIGAIDLRNGVLK